MRTFEEATIPERFGVELVRYRHHFQLTQDEMAAKCNLTRFVLINLEKGRSKLDLITIFNLYLECKSYVFFMFLYSLYGDDLLEKMAAECPEVDASSLNEWINRLRKKYPVEGPRYYDREGRRVTRRT